MKCIHTVKRKAGMTIVEMMVALAIIGVAVAGLTELSFLSTDWIDKFSNKVDASVATKLALEKIGSDVRSARNIGDCFEKGNFKPAMFPSSENPLFKSGLPSGALASYSVSDTTLIIQLPVVDKNGWPTLLPVTTDPKRGPNVDTIIYEVVADPESEPSGIQKYLMRRLVFAGKHDAEVAENITSGSTICPGVTILKGIVGPLDKTTGKPVFFQALDQTMPAAPPAKFDTISTLSLPSISGIVVNVEVMRNQGTSKRSVLTAFRSEIKIRNRSMVE